MAQLQKGIRAIMNYRWFVPAKIIAYVFLAVGLFGLITNNGLIAYGGAARENQRHAAENRRL
jgi:hypothetical protein